MVALEVLRMRRRGGARELVDLAALDVELEGRADGAEGRPVDHGCWLDTETISPVM